MIPLKNPRWLRELEARLGMRMASAHTQNALELEKLRLELRELNRTIANIRADQERAIGAAVLVVGRSMVGK